MLLDLLRDCKLEPQDKRSLLPIVIQSLSLILCDCPLANDKLEKSQGYNELFNEVNNLGKALMKYNSGNMSSYQSLFME